MTRRATVQGIAGLNKALRALPKEASVELRNESMKIAGDVASIARGRAMGVSKMYAKLVAPTIKARRDRVPVIAIKGVTMWGAEFGGQGRDTTMQFLPHLGTTGYALWPTIREELPDIMDRWADALYEAAIDAAARG